jgi:hypothetical protein
MTADTAVHGIRQRDAHSSIGLISAESDPPYNVLLWNIWRPIEAARELIKAPGPFTATDLKGRLSA